jgi:Na+-transporting methylmalonyl-CoA/oxaloacetate decarboxylase gamma subunit
MRGLSIVGLAIVLLFIGWLVIQNMGMVSTEEGVEIESTEYMKKAQAVDEQIDHQVDRLKAKVKALE